MQRLVEVEINCGEFSCVYCCFLCQSEICADHWCDLFGIDPVDYGDGPERTQECLNAEKHGRS